MLETMPGQFALQGLGRHHHRGGGCMETAQPAPHQRFRHELEAGMDIFGEAGVEGGGEGDAMLAADAARRQAQRSFGGDMHRIGGEFLDLAGQRPLLEEGQPDFRIGRHGKGAPAQRRDHAHGMTQRGQVFGQCLQGAHHAIDLRRPGIGDDQDIQMRRHAGNGPGNQALEPMRVQARPCMPGCGQEPRPQLRHVSEKGLPSAESPYFRGHLRQGRCSFQPSLRRSGTGHRRSCGFRHGGYDRTPPRRHRADGPHGPRSLQTARCIRPRS